MGVGDGESVPVGEAVGVGVGVFVMVGSIVGEAVGVDVRVDVGVSVGVIVTVVDVVGVGVIVAVGVTHTELLEGIADWENIGAGIGSPTAYCRTSIALSPGHKEPVVGISTAITIPSAAVP